MTIRLTTTTAALALTVGLLATPDEAKAQACLLDLDANGLIGLLLDGTGDAIVSGVDVAVACGPDASATGDNATAVGPDADASGDHSVAVGGDGDDADGVGAQASGDRGTAVGSDSSAGGTNSSAYGAGANAGSPNSTALGADSSATGAGATAVGYGASAPAANSVALGQGSIADQTDTVSVGTTTAQRRIVNVAAGIAGTDAVNVQQLNSTVTQATAELVYFAANSTGPEAVATGIDGIAIGRSSLASGGEASAIGKESVASAIGAVSIGNSSAATNINATAIGNGARADGYDATAIGTTALAQNFTATAIGRAAVATGEKSTAIGGSARASNLGSIAIGSDGSDEDADGANASGIYALALGGDTVASAMNSVALGYQASAVFQNAVAIGHLASANRANQMMLGTVNYTYTMPGLPTLPSNAAQSGTLYYVTTDAAGNLGYAAIPSGAINTAPGASTLAVTTSDAAVGFAPGEKVAAVTFDATHTVAEPPSQSDMDAGTRTAVRSASASLGPLDAPPLAAVTDAQFSALSGRVSTLEGRVDAMEFELGRLDRAQRGGIAAAMAFGGTMVVPDSNISFSLNASTYQGEQGFSGAVTARVGERIYVSGGIAGSTARNTTGGRVGVAFGF